ncbi:MAG: DUF3795 domain-containing protein [Ruminococcus sp.]|jgi:hypothetical protein|nr:DUF3795 domain-containing protein [Ruminococcus sp.]
MRISCCGLDCDACEYTDICRGCKITADGIELPVDEPRFWDSTSASSACEIRQCCYSKKLENCGFCKDFPCTPLAEFTYEDGMSDERLMTLKENADKVTSDRNKQIRRFIIGLCVGSISGIITGGIASNSLGWFAALLGADYRIIDDKPVGMASFVTAGILLGFLIPLILNIAEFQDNNIVKDIKKWLIRKFK